MCDKVWIGYVGLGILFAITVWGVIMEMISLKDGGGLP